MSRNKILDRIQQQVRERANYLCEFCHANEQWQYVRFNVDHVVPVSLGGSDNLDNLTLACFPCNRRKTNCLTTIDPDSQIEVPLDLLLYKPEKGVKPSHRKLFSLRSTFAAVILDAYTFQGFFRLKSNRSII